MARLPVCGRDRGSLNLTQIVTDWHSVVSAPSLSLGRADWVTFLSQSATITSPCSRLGNLKCVLVQPEGPSFQVQPEEHQNTQAEVVHKLCVYIAQLCDKNIIIFVIQIFYRLVGTQQSAFYVGSIRSFLPWHSTEIQPVWKMRKNLQWQINQVFFWWS